MRTKFHALSLYAIQICLSPQERILRFVKGLRSKLQITALQVAALAKSFQEAVDFMIEVEGVKPDDFTTASTFKKFCKRGDFSGYYYRGKSLRGFPTPLIQSSLQASAGVHRRPVSLYLCLEVMCRLRQFQRDLYLTPRNVMDVERLDILGNIVQNIVTDPSS